MKHNKLIRDKVPEIILKKEGTIPLTHIASPTEYHAKILEKLREEVDEFTKTETIDELVDIYEVLDAIMIEKRLLNAHSLLLKKKKQRNAENLLVVLF